MANFLSRPLLNIDALAPSRWLFDTRGGAIEGGRNGLGEPISIGLTGGPVVEAEIDGWLIEADQHEYGNWIAARMNSGVPRFMDVPIPSDFMGPFPDGVAIINGIPHLDGSPFSDGSGYSQATVYGEVMLDAPLNAGEIRIKVYGASRMLRYSDWFSIYHSVKGWRATRFWEVRDIDDSDPDNLNYLLAIEVPLRQAVTAGERVEFARPRCVMRFPAGVTVPYEVEPGFLWRPRFVFTEAF